MRTYPTARRDWLKQLLAALAVTLLEASHATTGVENLLLTGIEWVALGAYISRHVITLVGGTGYECIAA